MTSAFAAILITVNRAMSMHLIVNDFFIFRCFFFFANSSLLTVNKKDCMHTNTKNVEPVLLLVPRVEAFALPCLSKRATLKAPRMCIYNSIPLIS